MEIVIDGHSIDPSLIIGIILLAIFVNACLFGVVGQQFYTYWSSGFNDSKRVKVFVVIQFVINAFESIALWQMAWRFFITNYGLPLNLPAYTWELFTQLVCVNVLVLSANVFLAIRIYSFTKSRLQSGLVLAFSTSAFIAAMVHIVMGLDSSLKSSILATLYLSTTQNATSIVWRGLQVITECLIMIFLSRALLKSRSGLQKSDSVVNYLVRQVIQIGFLANLWVIAGLATSFLFPGIPVVFLVDLTVGSMYTHVIYHTLLSRVRLREHMAKTSNIEIMFSSKSQEKPDINGGQRGSSVSNGLVTTTSNLDSVTADTPRRGGGMVEHDDSETIRAPVGLPDGHFAYSSC